MFITSRRGCDRNGQQIAHGRFLMLMVTPNAPRNKVRGLVRFVRMHQLGNFMMARLTVKAGGASHKLSLSGCYGSDGLLLDVPQEVYDLGVDLPSHLYDKWAKGGGHNGAGSEGIDIYEWAKETFK